jgi:general stress protein YciG
VLERPFSGDVFLWSVSRIKPKGETFMASKEQHSGSSNKSGGQSQPGQSQPGKSAGGSGNFANDPKKASEAGKKGGQASHGGR